jgi:hypothetical protein
LAKHVRLDKGGRRTSYFISTPEFTVPGRPDTTSGDPASPGFHNEEVGGYGTMAYSVQGEHRADRSLLELEDRIAPQRHLEDARSSQESSMRKAHSK